MIQIDSQPLLQLNVFKFWNRIMRTLPKTCSKPTMCFVPAALNYSALTLTQPLEVWSSLSINSYLQNRMSIRMLSSMNFFTELGESMNVKFRNFTSIYCLECFAKSPATTKTTILTGTRRVSSFNSNCIRHFKCSLSPWQLYPKLNWADKSFLVDTQYIFCLFHSSSFTSQFDKIDFI
jgi:hypothetical protein